MDPRECCKREQFKYALYNQFKVPKLFRFADKGDWDKIPQRAKTHPGEARFVHAYTPSDTALHRVLRTATGSCELDAAAQQHIRQIQLEAVKALLEAYPESASIRDAFGRTPVHVACMDIANCGEAATYLIVESCPNAAQKQDDVEGRTPLHYLVGRNREVSIPLLARLVELYPEALKTADNVGETPYQIVKERGNEIVNGQAVKEALKLAAAPVADPSATMTRQSSLPFSKDALASMSKQERAKSA